MSQRGRFSAVYIYICMMILYQYSFVWGISGEDADESKVLSV